MLMNLSIDCNTHAEGMMTVSEGCTMVVDVRLEDKYKYGKCIANGVEYDPNFKIYLSCNEGYKVIDKITCMPVVNCNYINDMFGNIHWEIDREEGYLELHISKKEVLKRISKRFMVIKIIEPKYIEKEPTKIYRVFEMKDKALEVK